MQCHRFDPSLGRIYLVEGIFPMELTWVLTPFPQNSFGWEYEPRSGLCTHAFHHMDWKDPNIHVLHRWMPATKTHPVCTIHEGGMWLPQWLDLKNDHIYKNLTQNGEPQRYSWGMQKNFSDATGNKMCETYSMHNLNTLVTNKMRNHTNQQINASYINFSAEETKFNSCNCW